MKWRCQKATSSDIYDAYCTVTPASKAKMKNNYRCDAKKNIEILIFALFIHALVKSMENKIIISVCTDLF